MSDPTLDADVFDALQDSMGEEFVEDLVNTFLQEAPGLVAEVKAAAAEGDADRFRRGAHSLKSNANVFGAAALAAQSRRMELDGLDAGSAAEIEALEAHCAATAEALIEWRDG